MPRFSKYCSHCHKVKAFSFLNRKECDMCTLARASYRDRHRAEILKYQREYFAKDPTRYREVRRRYHRCAKNLTRALKYRIVNRESINKKISQWKKANPHKTKEYEQRRRLWKESGGVDCAPRIAILHRERFCHWCCQRLEWVQIDHVIPLSRNGSHVPDNLVACCKSCNSSRNNKLVSEWDWSSRQLEEAA